MTSKGVLAFRTGLVSLVAIAISFASSGAAVARTDAGAVVCKRGVVDRIGGKTVCIHVGGRCVDGHNARYRKRGYTCVSGRLRRYTTPSDGGGGITLPTTPPPPPPPPAVPGHYEGRTSQNEIIQFNVSADGLRVSGPKIQTINRSCNPGGRLYNGLDWLTAVFTVGSDGTFGFDAPNLRGSLSDGTPITGHLILHGVFSGQVVTGNFTLTDSFSYQGTAVSCSSGFVTFTATKT